MKRTTRALLIVLVGAFVGCDSKADQKAETETESAPVDAATVEKPKVAAVEAIEFDDKMFPGELPKGEQLGGFAFTDSAGENHVAFSREETETEGGNPATILHVKHVAGAGDHAKEVRSYREVVEECEFDIVMEPKFGDWSVTDLDKDGVGEATFAYTVDCTSDISPNKHKVFVTEGGEKFVLRGVTSVQIDDEGTIQGGEYEADEMNEAFRKHADMVWTETSVGLRM